MAARGIAVDLAAFASNGVLSNNVKVSCWVPTSAGTKTATPRVFYSDPALTTPATQGGTFGDTSGRRVIYLNPTTATVVEIESTDEATAYSDIYVPAVPVIGDIGGSVPLIVDNNAALTALTAASGLIDNGVYRTRGTSTERDGGQADWIYDSASTATATAAILAIDGGGAGRFYKWRGTAHHLDDFAGDTDTAKLQAAYAAVSYVQLTRSITVTSTIALPANFVLDGNGYTITKGFSGAMFTMATKSKMVRLKIAGAGATYTGNGITVSTGQDQWLLDVEISDTEGYNLEFTADGAGGRFNWLGGTFGRTNASSPAIKLPATESGSNGNRHFSHLGGNGSHMIDFSGGNLTYVSDCDAAGVTFGDACASVIIDGFCRIAQEPTIKGSYHRLHVLWTSPGAITLAANTNNCEIYVGPGVTVTDNSTVTTNRFIWPEKVYTDSSGRHVVILAADNALGSRMLQGSNGRYTEGTDASGNTELTAFNGELQLGGNGTANALFLKSASIEFGFDLLPTVTESLDIGSAAREVDNIFLQNAATVSDMRRKIDEGEIDGDQALAYYEKQTPRWFSWKPTVIPAHKEAVNEEYFENGEWKVRQIEVDVPERVIPHGRRHAGRFAQEVKEAIDTSGIGDFGGYAYEEENDTHVLRPLEDVALLIAAVKRLSARVRQLEGGQIILPSDTRITSPPQGQEMPEGDRPQQLPPDPESARLSDYGEVGGDAESDPGPVDVSETLPDEQDRAALLRLSRKYKQRINFLNNKSLDQTIEDDERKELAALYDRYHELAERGIRS